MCGIVFFYQPAKSDAERIWKVERALERLVHRGPDDSGTHINGSVVLGHRRLSIIDLVASHQPMQDPAERYSLVFNGEIYNYRELRTELRSKWNFVTHGDTEVVLAGLIIYGESFVEKMEGMWALALWDTDEELLLLSRDRMGKKPLYYQCNSDEFLCASELPALACLADNPWAEDEDSTFDYLKYGFYLPGTTAYRRVREVLPGNCLRWTPGRKPSVRQYWSLSLDEFPGTKKEAQLLLMDKVIAAVTKRLVADVEVGAFLSGGVDSSLVCSIIRRDLKRPLKTFTIGFEDASFDERAYARLAAEEFGTEHHEEVLHGWDQRELERLLLDHVGQPFADSSLLPTALVSRVAAKEVKVALSGDGGDELFCGYQRYQARNVLRWYSRLPDGLRHLAAKIIRALPEPGAHHSRSMLKKAHLFLDVVARQQAETPYVAPLMFEPSHLRRLAPALEGMGHVPPQIPEQTSLDDITHMMTADALIYLPQDILVKVDRASMAHSLETRAPFLDRAVVEFAFSLPRSWHRGHFKGKRMLSATFSNHLPNEIWRRRKQGFGVPIHAWFRDALGDRLLVMVSEDKTSPLSAKAVSTLLAEHRERGRDHGYRLWVLYAYLVWRSRNA